MSLVDKVTVHNNTGYDFFSSLIRIANNAAFTPAKGPNQEIRDWAEWALTQFPPDMRKLLTVFFNEEAAYGMTLCGYVAHWNTPSTRAFLARLEQLPAQDMLQRFLYIGIGPGKDISPDDIRKLIADDKEAVRFITDHLSFSGQEKWQVLQFIMDPESMKNDLMRLLHWHHDHIYSKVEEQITTLLQGAEAELREKLRKYGDEYLKLLMPVDHSNIKDPKIILALSYYLEKNLSINMIEDVYIYGYLFFEKIEGKHAVLAASQIFKALADETRLNIIRLLVERPWYGHELAQKLQLSNSTVSHHVTMLVMRGLVRTYREDTRIYYELVSGEFKRIIDSTVDGLFEEV